MVSVNPSLNRIPPLDAGDYLMRPEFECRYHASKLKKAELIEGIVYIPPVDCSGRHGTIHFDLTGWLGRYRVATPHVLGSVRSTLRLDMLNEPQPDILLRLDPSMDGQSWIDSDGYLQGAPELVAEISASSTSYDLNQKKDTYARHGIQEYLVFQMNEGVVSWFSLQNGHYEILTANDDGVICSRVFPGLWLNTNAFWDDDMVSVLAILQEGLASSEYQAFVEALSEE